MNKLFTTNVPKHLPWECNHACRHVTCICRVMLVNFIKFRFTRSFTNWQSIPSITLLKPWKSCTHFSSKATQKPFVFLWITLLRLWQCCHFDIVVLLNGGYQILRLGDLQVTGLEDGHNNLSNSLQDGGDVRGKKYNSNIIWVVFNTDKGDHEHYQLSEVPCHQCCVW